MSVDVQYRGLARGFGAGSPVLRIFRSTALLLGALTVATAAFAGNEIEEPAFSQAELDQMLAPIALYPDSLLSHILIASTYPLEVVEAARWSRSNPDLEAEDAVDAVEDQEWDPSVKALVAFPQVLARMDEDLSWTRRLGDAFLVQEEQVMDTIQSLRARAYEAGNLQTTEYVRVHREREIIVVEPVRSRVVYVPYYSTRVVYGHWWWPAYPPVYWAPPPVYYRSYASVGIFWGRPYYVPTVFYFSTFDWPRRVVVVNIHHRHRPSYYRPVTRPVRYSSLSTGESGFTRWQHDPRHRRGVTYRSASLNERYGRTSASGAVQTTTTEARRAWWASHAARYRQDRTVQDGETREDRSRFSRSADRSQTGRPYDRVTDRTRTPDAERVINRDRTSSDRDRTRPVEIPRTERPSRSVEIPRTERPSRSVEIPRTERSSTPRPSSAERREGEWNRSRPAVSSQPARTDRFRATTPRSESRVSSPRESSGSVDISRDRTSISRDVNRRWASRQQSTAAVNQSRAASRQEQPSGARPSRPPEARRQDSAGGGGQATASERSRGSLAPTERRSPRERERAPRQSSLRRTR